MTATSKDKGLEARYDVKKINDPDGKHDECRYFVLDPEHDPIARYALRVYAMHCIDQGHDALAKDLDEWLASIEAFDD